MKTTTIVLFALSCAAGSASRADCVDPPINDLCVQATLMPSQTIVVESFDNTCATLDGPPSVPCPTPQPFGKDVWFQYVAPCTGLVTASTCGEASFDMVMDVYGGEGTCSCPAESTLAIACGDDTCGLGGGPAQVNFSSAAGMCYTIRIGGWSGASGPGELRVECQVKTQDCNSNGIPDIDELEKPNNSVVFAHGMISPQDILVSQGNYPPGFMVPDTTNNAIYHIPLEGGVASLFATGFNSPRGATFAPDSFGGSGTRLFGSSIYPDTIFEVSSDGLILPFIDTQVNGLLYIPEHISQPLGGRIFITAATDSFGSNGAVYLLDETGNVEELYSSLGVGLWTPAISPVDFGDFGNHIFFCSILSEKVYALDPVDLALKSFASLPFPNSVGLRQIAFSPQGWAASLDPPLVDESVLLVSVASGGNQPISGSGIVSMWDQRGQQIGVLRSGPQGAALEPRGLLFVGDDLLVSDIADGHGWIINVSPGDFRKADCDFDGLMDECEIGSGASDCNANGVPDTCERACTGDPDQCAVANGVQDCDGNFFPDACENRSNCNSNSFHDLCDLKQGNSEDCDGNGVLDECELFSGFPARLLDNTVGFGNFVYVGPPDYALYAIAGKSVTFDFGPGRFVVDGSGADLTVYETSGGGPEFDLIDVLVSIDGQNYFSIKTTEVPGISILGDEVHDLTLQRKSYDLELSGLPRVRYVKVDGIGDESPTNHLDGFDLDAIGAIHLEADCDENGILDSCQTEDFDGDAMIDPCDPDIDDDGVVNDGDPCDFTPIGVPIDSSGRPVGDWDNDCLLALDDFYFLAICLPNSGPGLNPPFVECLEHFDWDDDDDVDLQDFLVFQRAFTGEP